jgi:hypothetical protein
MFCEEPDNPDMEMSCSFKLTYEIISFFSLLLSGFVVYATLKSIKMNLMHNLILQIIISEIVDEVNILLGIIGDIRGKLKFENYEFRMHICYLQIFLSVFSCLWTLTASLFISIKIYDIILNRNRIFSRNNFLNKHIVLITVSAPLIISYLFWVIHILLRTNALYLENVYVNKIYNKTQLIKLVFCWVNKKLSIALACIVALLIIGNLYFSVFKGFFFLKELKENILDQNEEENPRVKNINNIQGILFLYPLIACFIWIIFFLFIFLFYFGYREHTSKGWSIVFCIFMTIRQIIYTSVYFFSQKKLRTYTKLFLCCRTCKKNNKNGKMENPLIIN